MRTAAELAWAYGPVALMGEYYKIFYKDVETSAERFNIDIKSYCASLIWMITGETDLPQREDAVDRTLARRMDGRVGRLTQ